MWGKTEKVLLVSILFIGAVLRIWNFWDFSLSNDELSALARLNFTSFSDLIEQGVRIDGHPPLAQLILWYTTNWFGNSVAVVRLPFLLAGICSIYFMFRLAKEWVSTSAGLLSAASFATLIFPLLYSRIARPYALGMLFTLMAATFWIRIVKQKQHPRDLLWLSLSLALCAYAHYFAALTGAVLAVTGIFLVKGKSLKLYLLALVGAFVLYAPYIPTFLYQLSLGGVGQWLGPPENNWILQHIYYVFNQSTVVLCSTFLIGLFGFIVFRPKLSFTAHFLPFLLFLIPFLVGFLYSRYVNPVLQNSTLLFSFPFLLVSVFSGWTDAREKATQIASVLLLLITLWSTVVEKHFYRTNYFGVFKELAQHVTNWRADMAGDALLIGDFNFPFYITYYMDKGAPLSFATYRTTDETGLIELKSMVDTTTDQFVIYAWSTVNQVPEVEGIIREKFPLEVKRETYFNSEAVMFGKGAKEQPAYPFNFEKNEFWNFNPDAVTTDRNTPHVLISSENPYGPTFQIPLCELTALGTRSITVRVECAANVAHNELQLVWEQHNGEEGYSWESDAFALQYKKDGPTWGVFVYRLVEPVSENDVLKIYPWLPEGESVAITSMQVFLHKD